MCWSLVLVPPDLKRREHWPNVATMLRWRKRGPCWAGALRVSERFQDYRPGGALLDYREYQISQKPNVEIYFESELDAETVLEFGFENVCIATGATWRRDGVSRQHVTPFLIDPAMPVFTPDDLMEGAAPLGHSRFMTTITTYGRRFGRIADPKRLRGNIDHSSSLCQ